MAKTYRNQWTAEQEEQLKRLHAEGLAFGLIARRIGRSRNSMIGKARRMGLPMRAPENGNRGRNWTPPPPKQKSFRVGTPSPRRKSRGPTIPHIVELPPAPPTPENYVAFAVLNGCRWPMGELPNIRFCDEKCSERAHGSYCDYHCNMAYERPHQRRRLGFVTGLQMRMGRIV